MKNVLKTLVALMAMSAALTACVAELTESPETSRELCFEVAEAEDPVDDEAADEEGIETRTYFSTASGTYVRALWTGNEDVYVSYYGQYKGHPYGIVGGRDLHVASTSSNHRTAKFSSASPITLLSDGSDYVFSLLSPKSVFASNPGTVGTLNITVPTNQTPIEGSPDEKAMVLGAVTSPYATAPSNVKFSPMHMTAYICLNLSDAASLGTLKSVTVTATVPLSGSGTFDWSSTYPSIKAASSGTSNSVTATTSRTSGIWFACYPAQVAGKKLTIKAVGSAKTLTKEITVPSGKNLTAGKIATLTVDIDPAVHVTGVSVSPTTLTLQKGKTSTLTATVTPSNATDKTVTWSSSNTSVATVTSAGVVKGVATGTATITATTNDGGKKATCAVTVTNPPVRVEFAVRVSPQNTDYQYDAGENVLHLANGGARSLSYYVYYADGSSQYCASGWTLSLVSGSGVRIYDGTSIQANAVGKTATVRLSSTAYPSVYSNLVVKTWAPATAVTIAAQNDVNSGEAGMLGWIKENTTSRIIVTVEPSTARQKVVINRTENSNGWTIEQTSDLQFKITAPSVNGSTVSAYTNKALTAHFICQTGNPAVDQTFTPTNLDLSQPKLLDYIAYAKADKTYCVVDGGLRIQIKSSDGYGTKDFYCVSKPYDVKYGYTAGSPFVAVGIVSGYYPGQIPKNTVTTVSSNFPKVVYQYEDGCGNFKFVTLTKGSFHGFAVGLHDCDQTYWSKNNGDVDSSEHWNRSWGTTHYPNSAQDLNAFDLTVLAAYHNGALNTNWTIYPVDRTWNYPDPGFEYDVHAWSTVAAYKMRPWVTPTVANFWMLRDGNNKLHDGAVMAKVDERMANVGGVKMFTTAKPYWTINTYDSTKAVEVVWGAYNTYTTGYEAKQSVRYFRPFMVF